MSVLTAARDFSRKVRLAWAIKDNLLKHGRPGGVDIERYKDEEGTAALMWLLQRDESLTVVKSKKKLMLMVKADVDVVFTPGMHQQMYRNRIITSPTEDLFDAE